MENTPSKYSADHTPDKLQPEEIEIIETYLVAGNIEHTASKLNIARTEVVQTLNKRAVKSYMDALYMDVGYMNRFKLADTMSAILDARLEELQEAEIPFQSSKDLVDIITALHKMSMDNQKATVEREKVLAPTTQTNNQLNVYGEGQYGDLMKRLLKPEK